MGIEIERKFLVKNDTWQPQVSNSIAISQGYLTRNSGLCSVRVRLQGDKANLNIKSRELGIQRQEYEYPVPVEDAQSMLNTLCSGVISKVRHHIEYEEKLWELDVFAGENDGLVVAEIELNAVDESFALPDWVGEEVTDDPRYYNVNLIDNPYSQW